MYYSAHLSECQQKWHPFEQEFYALLNAKCAARREFGPLPCVCTTDHGNLARVDSLPLERVEAKHFRWNAEIRSDGSKLLYAAGTGTRHRGPDALSRHPPGRDQLILARSSEWDKYRACIRGVELSIASGQFVHEDPGVIEVDTLPPEKLEPVPFEELQKAGVVEDSTPTWVRQRLEEAKRQAAMNLRLLQRRRRSPRRGYVELFGNCGTHWGRYAYTA
jgi:hypothetical protein